MPTPPDKRDYKKEWRQDQRTGKDKAHIEREKARNIVDKEFGKEARKGKVVAHVKALSNKGKSVAGNLKIESFKENAHFKRKSNHDVKE